MVTRVLEDLIYQAEIGERKVVMDAGSGRNQGQSPLELVLSALAGCATVDVLEILKKRRKDVRDLIVESKALRREEPFPRIFTQIEMVFKLQSPDVTLSELEKAISLSLEKYCSVRGMLDPAIKISARGLLVSEVDPG